MTAAIRHVYEWSTDKRTDVIAKNERRHRKEATDKEESHPHKNAAAMKSEKESREQEEGSKARTLLSSARSEE